MWWLLPWDAAAFRSETALRARRGEISRAEARAIIAGLSELDTKVEAATEEDERRVLNLRERFREEFGFDEESGTGPDGETYTGPAWAMSNY